MLVHGFEVQGELIDSQTRCKHYHKEVDIVAIKFKCCDTYYPCYKCHNETVDHPAERWRDDEFDEKAILCGACGAELTINEYMNNPSACPKCRALFNPNCENHSHLYFEV
ncbi:hypothetical protein GN156_15110 [bacterium LRH843]|nr:hypothetical protein [bacterium LRH843]